MNNKSLRKKPYSNQSFFAFFFNYFLSFFFFILHGKFISDLLTGYKVYEKFYSKMPTLSFILKIYYLPTNIINYILKVKKIYDYNWCLKEIEVLEKEIYEDKIKS